MAYEGSRLSAYSNPSSLSAAANTTPSGHVSTQTLLNALHTSYSQSKALSLESSTSLVVNSFLTTAQQGPDGERGGTVDSELARRAWEHARRRCEDGLVVLASLHESSPSLLVPFIQALPFSTPDIVRIALDTIRPFVSCVTPQNPACLRYSSLGVTFSLAPDGDLASASLKLSSSGIDVHNGLLSIPAEQGYRAFDVFYYLLSSASSQRERDFLGLRSPSGYRLLKKSGTYDTPSYIPTADDSAAAEEWKDGLKAIGVTPDERRSLVSILAALLDLGDTLEYLLDEEDLVELCQDAAGLLELDPEVLVRKASTEERPSLIAGIYEGIVEWVMSKANAAIAKEMQPNGPRKSSGSSAGLDQFADPGNEAASIQVIDIPSTQLGRAAALKTVFDDSEGINAEMKEDGITFAPAGHSVLTEMQAAVASVEPDLGIMGGRAGQQRELERDRREGLLDRIMHETEPESFLGTVLRETQHSRTSKSTRFDLWSAMSSCRTWFQLCVHPTDELPAKLVTSAAPWSAGAPSRQLRAWRLPEWANRRSRQIDYTADFDVDEFCNHFARLGCKEGRDGVESFVLERGWSNGEVVLGTERVWIRESAWWEAENQLDVLPVDHSPGDGMLDGYGVQHPEAGSGFFGGGPFQDNEFPENSQDNLLASRHQSMAARSMLGARSLAAPTVAQSRQVSGGDYGLGFKGDAYKPVFDDELDPEMAVEEYHMSKVRRAWVAFVWGVTFWIPSFALQHLGRMKRPDVRMAWREKLVLVALITLMNGVVLFYIVEFGRLLCPNLDKAWNNQQVSTHQGLDDFYVSVRGNVYDISKFIKVNHGITGAQATPEAMEPLAGLNLDVLFPIPLNVACPNLVKDANAQPLQVNQTAINQNISPAPPMQHISGPLSPYVNQSSLGNPNWYNQTFLPAMQDYYKGTLVWAKSDIKKDANNDGMTIVYINNNVYDLSPYFYNKQRLLNQPSASFLDPTLESIIQQNAGQDITHQWNNYVSKNQTGSQWNWQCLNNAFYVGQTDFRQTAKCQVNNYILLAFTIIIVAVIGIKFLSALQLSSKKRPAQQDKFVICQVPCYTEGEEHLRKGLDSLCRLEYDNKRKMIMVICDGVIQGEGNDRPTPKIVLDIFGVDSRVDPPALPFKSCGVGSDQLNYGKVYSGLYEFEGNVLPFVVIVKVGKESERAGDKPGNRGKRDSQLLVMNFLNRVHFMTAMNPLELEIFHQINNIIGVDPELYEYLFTVDADTLVAPDSLNRLVAQCANDAKVAANCGETSLQNEERSWTTMIQVYEYYISHHLSKAFESLFGSVTCLPGCFSMYRLRTADKGRPLLISDKVINDYAIKAVDTLHKKNLLSLGEDRYLTTLMTKHFPNMRYKFVQDAHCKTAAPESWSVLLSQRRRWINSTVHNLAELVLLRDLCGFCCFSMRFVVFIDLMSTIILPATCGYIIYLIYSVASHTAPLPIISIALIAAIYGLQAVIFLIKRQWQHIGWMIIYLLAYPIYSVILPIYSFWKQDDFSWGNTRMVIGEKGSKKFVASKDEGFDPRSIPLQTWNEYATVNGLPGRRDFGPAVAGMGSEKAYFDEPQGYEMDEVRSTYSGAKPASTILTGFKSQQGFYMPPQSPAPQYGMRPGMPHRQSQMSQSMLPRYTDHPSPMRQSGMYNAGTASPMAMSEYGFPRAGGQQSPYMHGHAPSMGGQQMGGQQSPYMHGHTMSMGGFPSQDNLLSGGQASPMPMNRAGRRSPMPFAHQSRPASTVNFQTSITGAPEPSDEVVVEAIRSCLAAVDLDNVTKKQLKALTEQRLQCQLSPAKREFLDQQIDNELANM